MKSPKRKFIFYLLFTFLVTICCSIPILFTDSKAIPNILNTVDVKDYVGILEFSGNVSTLWIDRLEEELQNEGCLLVITVINSPGGDISTSMNVAHEFKLLQKRYGKGVCVFSNYGMYSGAYMVATATPFIGVSPGASTGSIGVVMVHANALKYWKDLGVEFDIIRSGENKFSYADINKLTPEQHKVMQDMVNESYNDFIDLILDSRYYRIKNALQVLHNDVIDSLKAICDGRIYSSKIAQSIGLIDVVCYYDEFMQLAYTLYSIPYDIEYKMDDEYYNISGEKVE